jgi:two-component system, chemotaxis family, sensor kinase CheA
MNMTEYLELFLQETTEQLEILESEMSKIYGDPSASRIDAIFRAAHTVKGSSRAMGFGNYADLTHEIEDVLFKIRDNSLAVSKGVEKTLIVAIDAMVTGKEHIEQSGNDVVLDAELVAQLKSLIAGGMPVAKPVNELQSTVWPAEVIAAASLVAETTDIFELTITLEDSCSMKYVRVFMALSALGNLGEVLASDPCGDELEHEKFDLSVRVLCTFEASIDEVRSNLSTIGEIEKVDIAPWLPSEFDDAPAPINTPIEAKTEQRSNEDRRQNDRRGETESKKEVNQTIRVDVSLLDNLLNLVGELVIDRTRLSQLGANIAAKVSHSEDVEGLAETIGHIARITNELQEQIMRARMLPIDTVFQRFPRVVRDLSKKLGKEVEFEVLGGDTEVDRSVIEGISDPLIHMIRNSLDHGLETPSERVLAGKSSTGTVRLSARHQDNAIWIELEDDGHGIDPDRLRAKAVEKGILTSDAAAKLSERDALMLIFASGFSTAAQVTDVSGRGVGMDIVRSNIQAIGGIIDMESTLGKGTKFILKLPLTVAIMRGLVSNSSDVDYVIPLASVLETFSMNTVETSMFGEQLVTVLRGETIPLLSLSSLFPLKAKNQDNRTDAYLVVVGAADKKIGLVVEKLLGEQEVVIKSISPYCGKLVGLSGATILGNGRIALIIDVNAVANLEKGF